MEKVSLPKGTRDFGPVQMAKRQFIIDSIKNVFQKYGFQPLETPAMENLSTLTGKYGEEGDKLLFKVLDSGDYYEKAKSLKKEISNIDVGSAKVGRLVRILLDALWILGELIEEKYLDAKGKYLNYEFLSQLKDQFLTTEESINNLVREPNVPIENKQLIASFMRQEPLFLISRTIETLKRIEGEDESKENFTKTFLSAASDQLIPSLTEFNANHLLNLFSSKELTPLISEKGLRYDLTVPFARYVVMNRHEITFPFKRYQIQPVWRADRPQKGRYREFYQCDADVVGTDSLVCEAEIILMIKDAFKALGIKDYSIKINHRAILSGLADILEAADNENALFVAIDKLDKIGEEKVKEELGAKGFTEASLSLLFEILNFQGTTVRKIDFLSQKISASEKGKKGLNDINEVLSIVKSFGATDEDDHVEFDISLARGLSYYTGCIVEVKINNVGVGSVSGGGRYDNLTAVFDSREKSSGVGFSFGIDRIYDAMEELKIFPKEATAASTVLVAHLDEASFTYGLKITQMLRENEIASEIFPDQIKVKKQMEYADKKKIPFVIVIGSEEVKTGQLTLKKMESGEQLKLSFQEIANAVQLYK
jgi:histidyl-tRNA synthetase